MPQIGLKSGCNWSNFGGKSGVDDAGSLLGSFPNIIFFRKKIHFLPPPIFSKSGPMQIHVEAQPKYTCACEDPSETCVNRRENMIRKKALLHFDDVGSLLHVLGCLLGSFFFLRENNVFPSTVYVKHS